MGELFIDSVVTDTHAIGVFFNDGNRMCVKAGSKVSLESHLSNQKKMKEKDKLRRKLEADGTIKDRIFTIDYEFTSASTAAAIILGSSSSGMKLWKNKDGVSLGELINIDEDTLIPTRPKKYRLTARGADAYGYPLEENQFLVLSNSKLSSDIVPSLSNSLKNMRNKMEEEGIIKNGILTVDYPFTSPSTAASVISGSSMSGSLWKEE